MIDRQRDSKQIHMLFRLDSGMCLPSADLVPRSHGEKSITLPHYMGGDANLGDSNVLFDFHAALPKIFSISRLDAQLPKLTISLVPTHCQT